MDKPIENKIYRFLTGPDDASFCHKVTKALSEGWHLYEAPQYAYNAKTGQMCCAQAVYKNSDKIYNPTDKLSEY